MTERIEYERVDDHTARLTIAGLGTVLVAIIWAEKDAEGNPIEGLRVIVDPASPDVPIVVDQP